MLAAEPQAHVAAPPPQAQPAVAMYARVAGMQRIDAVQRSQPAPIAMHDVRAVA